MNVKISHWLYMGLAIQCWRCGILLFCPWLGSLTVTVPDSDNGAREVEFTGFGQSGKFPQGSAGGFYRVYGMESIPVDDDEGDESDEFAQDFDGVEPCGDIYAEVLQHVG